MEVCGQRKEQDTLGKFSGTFSLEGFSIFRGSGGSLESCVSQAGKNPVDFPGLAEQRVQEGPGEGTDRGCKRGLEGSAEEGLKPQEYST